jgi:TetR/AcrR family transcriptional regulator, regulator of autoinduction and epiphytic fitness
VSSVKGTGEDGTKPEGRRQRAARRTRQRITAAAHELFLAQGYEATTIRQIADRADVAWQTVYAVFGNKVAILNTVFDVAVAGDDEPVRVMDRPFAQAIRASADPVEKARLHARHMRETYERIAGIVGVIEAAAAADPEIAGLWQRLQDQRRYGMGVAAADMVQAAGEQGRTSPLPAEHAADVLWFLTGPWAYRALVVERGWRPDEYEDWMARTIAGQLFQ